MPLKIALTGVMALVAILIATQNVAALTWENEHSPANRLSREVVRTNNTAGQLDSSFTSILPPGAYNVGTPGEDTPQIPGVTITIDDKAAPDPPDGQQAEATDETITDEASAEENGAEQEPDRKLSPANPADTTVEEAEAFQAELTEELELKATLHTAEVAAFYSEWNTRYEEALDSHRRFQWRIQRVHEVAPSYFEAQRELTDLMPNQARKQQYRLRDQEEMELYQTWQQQANQVLGHANIIMDELRQLNLEIAKMRLTATFNTIQQDFNTIPHAVTQLHHELESFRTRSEALENRLNQTLTGV